MYCVAWVRGYLIMATSLCVAWVRGCLIMATSLCVAWVRGYLIMATSLCVVVVTPTVIFLRQSLLYFPVLSCVSTCLPALGHFLGLLYTLLMWGSDDLDLWSRDLWFLVVWSEYFIIISGLQAMCMQRLWFWEDVRRKVCSLPET